MYACMYIYVYINPYICVYVYVGVEHWDKHIPRPGGRLRIMTNIRTLPLDSQGF